MHQNASLEIKEFSRCIILVRTGRCTLAAWTGVPNVQFGSIPDPQPDHYQETAIPGRTTSSLVVLDQSGATFTAFSPVRS